VTAGSFLGKGWRFPVDVNRNGGVAVSAGEDLIRESIAIVLGTAPGERVMRPQFGCDIHELLFAPNNANTAGLAAHYCVEALTKWEPRIADVEADADPSRDEPNKLLIHIRYKVRQTGTTHNMVYPFYLRRSEEG
jgi:phage baseplate assembly protein W